MVGKLRGYSFSSIEFTQMNGNYITTFASKIMIPKSIEVQSFSAYRFQPQLISQILCNVGLLAASIKRNMSCSFSLAVPSLECSLQHNQLSTLRVVESVRDSFSNHL